MAPLLEIDDLSIEFRSGRDIVYALEGMSLAVGKHERVAIVGESGSGKAISAISALKLLPPNARRTSGGT